MNSSISTLAAAHNIFTFDDIIFSSNFDNGNLGKVERVPNKPYDFKVWTAPDNMGTEFQSKHCAWFHFVVSGLPLGCVLRIQIVNASNHSGLYKFDMRPVYRCNSTGQKWNRIKSSVRFNKETEGSAQLFFEHGVDTSDDKIYFAFTYPYSYSTLQNELTAIVHENNFSQPDSIFYQRELLTLSRDGRRVDLLTISSVDGCSTTEKEPLLSGLFPDSPAINNRPPLFPNKEIMFISARVHPGEVPAQHTFKGILNLLLDPDDLRAKELRRRYVFKLIPMLNPDGVYRGHFRMDQLGQNLNRYYCNPDSSLQPSIFAAKSLMDYYAGIGKLAVYLDFHAHASKRGCFIYGNVLDSVEDQIQNQLYCKLISMNSAHFDYEGCLFSREHMFRTDPGDQAKGLTAEGSGRVWTYLTHGIIHSYTIESNYNTSRVGNEIAAPETEPGGASVTPPSNFTTNPEKYTPSTYAGVGRACVIAILDLKGHNPCSLITKSKLKTLDRVRNFVMLEVRNKREFLGKGLNRERRRLERKGGGEKGAPGPDELMWRRVVDAEVSSANGSSAGGSGTATPTGQILGSSSSKVSTTNAAGAVIFIPSKERRRRRSMGGATTSLSDVDNDNDNFPLNTLIPTPPSSNHSNGVSAGNSPDLLLSSQDVIENNNGNKRAAPRSTQLVGGIAAMVLEENTTKCSPRMLASIKVPSRDQNSSPSPLSNSRDFRAIGIRNHSDTDDYHGHSGSLSARNSSNADPSPQSVHVVSSSAKQVNTGMPPPRRTSASPRVGHKDNRKILGKALNPAGVALLMSTAINNSSNSTGTPPPINTNSPRLLGTHQHQMENAAQQSNNMYGPNLCPTNNIASLPDVLIISSVSGSRKELHNVCSKDSLRDYSPCLPDIVRRTVSSDDLPHLSSVPIDNNATLNKLVAATLLQGQQQLNNNCAAPRPRKTSSDVADYTTNEVFGIAGSGPARRGSYSIKAALQQQQQQQQTAYPPSSAGTGTGNKTGNAFR